MGLGSVASVGLAAAREKAQECRRMVAKGIDPLEVKREPRVAIPAFGQVAEELIASREGTWRNEKHRAQWRMTLTVYAKPLWAVSVDKIDTEAVLACLKPIWVSKPETASRVRGRIEAVLDYARARKWRGGENPAQWRGHLAHLLPKRGKLSRGHHAAMPYRDVPAFIARLRECEGVGALALEFTILTAARTGEVIGATWGEIEGDVWTIPAVRMKAAREHRVPLSARAMAIADQMRAVRTNAFVFPGPRGRGLSNMAMDAVLRRMGSDVTVHGFRSAYRDWCAEQTSFPHDVIEQSLAHTAGSKVELAYKRTDHLEKRRALAEAWAQYCEPTPVTTSNVIKLKA